MSGRSLGERGQAFFQRYSYGFYIGSLIEENYKYRVFNVDYNQDYYPLKIELDHDIFDEIQDGSSVNESSTIIIENSSALENCLAKIFHSRKINFIVGNLMDLKKE